MNLKESIRIASKQWKEGQESHMIFLKPKFYFLIKSLIVAAIILQRVAILTQNDHEDELLYSIIQLAAFPILIVLEITLVHLIIKSKKLMHVADILLCAFQAIFCEIILNLTIPIAETRDRKLLYMVQQEILFICSHTILFTNSVFTKTILLLYTTSTAFFRISPPLPTSYLATYGILLLSLILAAFVVFFIISPKKTEPEAAGAFKSANGFSSLENIPHGLAVLTKDKEVLFMNGIFKGLLDLADEKDALEKIMRLKRFAAYPEETQQRFLQEIKVRMNFMDSQIKEKDSTETGSKDKLLRGKTSLEREPEEVKKPSIELPRITFKGSIFQKTPVIFVRKPVAKQDQNFLGVQNSNMLDSSGLISSLPETPESASIMLKHDLNEQSSQSPKDKEKDKSNGGVQIKELRYLTSLQSNLGQEPPDTVGFSINNVLSTLNDESSPCLMDERVSLAKVAKGVVRGLVFKRASQYFSKDASSISLTNTKTQKIQTVYRNVKGELRILELTLTPMVYEGKEAVFLHLNDITSEMKAKELQESSQHKDRLLKFVSHEFRTPLNCSIISLNMLKPHLSKDLLVNFLDPALHSNTMLLNLVNDILDFSQMQAKKLKIAISPWNVKTILQDVVTMMEMQAAARHVDLKLDWDFRISHTYYTDGNRLKQILLNLVSNALKFTIQGSITIKASFISQKVCRIEVADTGVGISKEGLESLFQEFGKVQENINLNPQGVGLGLVISKLLSKELSPNNVGLEVTSEAGVGTTFYFLLASKTLGDEQPGFENTDLASSDEEENRLQKLMPTISGSPIGSALVIRNSTGQFLGGGSMKSYRSSSGRGKAKTETPKRMAKNNHDPFTFNFTHSYSKGTFSDMTKVIAKYSQYPQPKGKDYYNNNGRSKNRVNSNAKRSFSSENISSKDDNDYRLQKLQEKFRKLNQICKCAKVLVVDDNAFNLTALKLMLKGFGIEATTAIDGEQAIHQIIDNEGHNVACRNFAIIFMDIEMPRLNGFETAKSLRKMMLSKEIAYIPIIGITGHNPQEKRVECLLSGMNDMVSKPVTPQTIQELICKWVTI